MSGSVFDVIEKMKEIKDIDVLPASNITKLHVGKKFGRIEMLLDNDMVADIISRNKSVMLLVYDNDLFKRCYDEVLKENEAPHD
jgi:hypothetical protein